MDELIQCFNENEVRYLVFGGQAVRLAGMPRFSMDWDLFIPGKDAANMERINNLLVDEAEAQATEYANENGLMVNTFSLEDLIASKEAVGRPQDLEDVEFLKIRKQRTS